MKTVIYHFPPIWVETFKVFEIPDLGEDVKQGLAHYGLKAKSNQLPIMHHLQAKNVFYIWKWLEKKSKEDCILWHTKIRRNPNFSIPKQRFTGTQSCSFIMYGWWLLLRDRSRAGALGERPCSLLRLQYFCSGPSQKRSANPWCSTTRLSDGVMGVTLVQQSSGFCTRRRQRRC